MLMAACRLIEVGNTLVDKVVKRISEDLDAIYAMGYDVWGEGNSYADYLEGCRTSSKYQTGTWYVLIVDGEQVSSCILYQLSTNVIGIGSLATKYDKRGRGFGTFLLKKILSANIGRVSFLWSDINPNFYKKIGFVLIDSKLQPYDDSKLMYYPSNAVIDHTNLPTYF